MKKVGKFLLGVLELAILVFAVIVIALMIGINEFGYTKLSGDTYIAVDDVNIVELKDYTEGDLILVKETKYNDIEVGDKVFYYGTLDNHYLVNLGTIKSKEGDNREAIYTFEENPNITVSNVRIIGKEDKVYNNMGNVYNVLTSKLGFLLIVILPILVIFIYQVYSFIMTIKEDREDENEEKPKKKNVKKEPIKEAIEKTPTKTVSKEPGALPKLKPRNKE